MSSISTNFESWLQCIDDIVHATISLHLYDLPDEDFYTMYQDGKTSKFVATMIIDDFHNFIANICNKI